jgi:hypothetical protein
MTVKFVYQAALRWGIAAASFLIILAMVAGCVDLSPAKAGNASPSNGGSGGGSGIGGAGLGTSGGTGGSGSGSSGGSSVVADKDNQKVSFYLNCQMTEIDKDESRTVRLSGDVPFLMSRDWDKKPNIDLMQFYTDIPKEAKLNLYHEYQDKSCHFIYDGPVWITAGIRHNAGDAPADWSALIVPGTETMNARSGELTQYVKNMAPGCPQSTDDWATTGILGSVTCFEMDYKPMTFGEGSTITFTSDDPKVKLDSTAVFQKNG